MQVLRQNVYLFGPFRILYTFDHRDSHTRQHRIGARSNAGFDQHRSRRKPSGAFVETGRPTGHLDELRPPTRRILPLHNPLDRIDGPRAMTTMSPRTGIHQKVDGMLHKLDAGAEEVTKGVEATVFEDLSGAVFGEFPRERPVVGSIPNEPKSLHCKGLRIYLRKIRMSPSTGQDTGLGRPYLTQLNIWVKKSGLFSN